MSQLAAVDEYVETVEKVTAQLRAFAYKAQGSGLAGGSAIAAAAEGQTWTLKQFRVRVDHCIRPCYMVPGSCERCA